MEGRLVATEVLTTFNALNPQCTYKLQPLNVVFSIRSDYARHKRQTWKQGGVSIKGAAIKGSGPVIKGSRDGVQI
jgi:hypothetical protein